VLHGLKDALNRHRSELMVAFVDRRYRHRKVFVMRRIMKLAAVSTLAAGLLGAGASSALAGDYTEITATETAQCISAQEAGGFSLLIGAGANVNALNAASCTGSVNINDN
jgi:hypothetical protein